MKPVLAFLLFTCGAASAQELRMGVQGAFVIDPHVLMIGPNMAAARHIYDSFIGRDVDARWVPALATGWTQRDARTWEFSLRQGVRFNDGSPFTADDVIASFRRIPAIPNNPGPYTSNLRTITDTVAVDPFTVRITTDRPNPMLPGQLTNVFIVARSVLDATPDEVSSGRAAIGTGPFRVVSYRHGDGAVLEPNPHHWGARPEWQRVVIRVIGNDTSRVAALLAGDVDLIEFVPPTDVARLKATAGVSVFGRPADRVAFLLPNVGPATLALATDRHGQKLERNPLRDLRVRQAISLAIDRHALVEKALSGQGEATIQLVPEGFGGWDPAVTVPPGDPAAAKAQLAAAGHPDGFAMTMACPNDRWVDTVRVCQAIAQMLSRAGFAMRLESMPGSVYFPRSRPGRNEWPLVFYEISLSSLRDGQYILQTVAQSYDEERGMGSGNSGGFSDPALDRMIEAAVVRSDADREVAIRQAMAAAVDRLGIIPLFIEPTIVAARATIVYRPRLDQQFVATQAKPAASAR